MKGRVWIIAAAAGLLAPPLAAQQTSSSRTIQCGTGSTQRVECDAGGRITRVRLLRDLSANRCAAPGSWGWTETAVWTDNTCRGEFEVGYGTESASASDSTRRITCGTLTTQQAKCSTGGPATSVRLVQEATFARCRQGSNWGFSDSLIWAGNGCRAEFEVAYRGASTPQPQPASAARTITCGLASGQQETCRTEGYAMSVRLVRDLGGTECRKGYNWDHTPTFIWANKGCRAEFEVTYRDAAPTKPQTRMITCGSTTTAQVRCTTGGEAYGVRLVRDLAGNRCREGTTWGHTETSIWTRSGCRAEFLVTYHPGTSPQPTPGPTPGQATAPGTRVLSCGDSSGSAMACNAFGTVASVRLQRDRSAGRCDQTSSWGVDGKSIWVARGCYGDFELTYATAEMVR
jgi:hypothetical protein